MPNPERPRVTLSPESPSFARNLNPLTLPDRTDATPADVTLQPVALSGQVSDGWARCLGVAVCDEHGVETHVFEQGQRAVFWYEFEVQRDTEVPIAGLVIQSDKGTLVHGKSTLEHDVVVPIGMRAGERLRVRHDIALEIGVGEYTFEIGLAMIGRTVYARRRQLPHVDIAFSSCITARRTCPGVWPSRCPRPRRPLPGRADRVRSARSQKPRRCTCGRTEPSTHACC